MKICGGCNIRHAEELSCAEAEVRRDRRHLKILRRAVKWALGELGDFPIRGDGDGAYHWRIALRRKVKSIL